MNNKQRKILKRIFDKPTKSDIKWQEVVSLLNGVGATIHDSASGSRVGISYENVRMVLHKPHPQKEINKYVVDDLRDFFTRIGVTP